MERVKQVWVGKDLRVNDRGHFELTGDCGAERIVVELDHTITKDVAPENRESVLLEMHGRIQDAARRKHAAGEAYPVHPPGRRPYSLIALTDLDLLDV